MNCFQAATLTGTYKLIKRDLQREGFDIHLIGPDEEIFFMGPNDKQYRCVYYKEVTIADIKLDRLLRVEILQGRFLCIPATFNKSMTNTCWSSSVKGFKFKKQTNLFAIFLTL